MQIILNAWLALTGFQTIWSWGIRAILGEALQ